jgi:ATP-dependent DNA ligase
MPAPFAHGGARFQSGTRKLVPNTYVQSMLKAFEFCIPMRGTKVPSGPDWLHEIKYDGYRLRVERNGDRVRLITRRGYDWSKRFPCIVEAALKNRQKQFVIDGEAVILGIDGISDFDALHSGRHKTRKCSFARSTSWQWTATISQPATIDAQDKSRTPSCAQARGHLRQSVRAWRDRP